jgi:hypothetical protein
MFDMVELMRERGFFSAIEKCTDSCKRATINNKYSEILINRSVYQATESKNIMEKVQCQKVSHMFWL